MSTDKTDTLTLIFRDRPGEHDFPYFVLSYHGALPVTPWAVLCVPSPAEQLELVALLLYPTMTSHQRRDELRTSVMRYATRTDAEAAILRDAASRGATGEVLVQVKASVPSQ